MNTVLIVLGVAAYVAIAVALFFLLRKMNDKFVARGWRCPDMYNPWMDLLVAALWPVQIVGIIYGVFSVMSAVIVCVIFGIFWLIGYKV